MSIIPLEEENEFLIDNQDLQSIASKSEDQIIRDYIRQIAKYPILSLEEEKLLLTEYFDHGNQEAGKQIVLSHLRIVIKIAMKYRNYGLSMMDIISEGNAGLLHALKMFDRKKNVRFSTYAMLWIRASIQDFIVKSWSLVKVGSVALRKAMLFNLKKTKQAIGIESSDSNQVMNSKLAENFGIKDSEMENISNMFYSRNNISIDRNNFNSKEDSGTMLDILESDSDHVADIANKEEILLKIEAIKEALNQLNEKEKDIILQRYIAPDGKKITLDVLSKKYQISKERVRQIENKAIEKLQFFARNFMKKLS